MESSPIHYLPLPLPFFAILIGIFLALVLLLQLGALRYAYLQLGLTARGALFLLLASLIGSYLNLPVAHLPGHQAVTGEDIDFFGMRYSIPVLREWPGTIIALNVGGAIIPTVMSIYLLSKKQLWGPGLLATAVVAAVCHWLAQPIPGLGIALPVFVPSVAAAVIALLLSRTQAAALAYVSGSLGALIGADLLNLGSLQGLGAPVASIGGAGTFDGIFLTGILAVLIASLSRLWSEPELQH
jgi:uncharacterized membrane protein